MGVIRGSLLVIISVLFLVSLLSMNFFWTFSKSLEYENVKSELVPVVKEFADDKFNLSRSFETNYPVMEMYCENNSEFVFQEYETTFVIPCEIVKTKPDTILDKMIDDAVLEIYSRKYDCGFFDCFSTEKTAAFFLVSQHTKDYFSSKFYLMVLISIILGSLIFLFTENKSNAFVISGVLIIFSGLPFAKLSLVLEIFAQKEYLQFFTFMFTQAFSIFVKCIIIGVVLALIGFLLKTFSLGFKIREFFDKFKKPEVVVKEKSSRGRSSEG